MDPRYKLQWYVEKKWRNDWVNHCRRTVKEVWRSGYKLIEEVRANNGAPEEQQMSIFGDFFRSPQASARASDELSRYLAEPRVDPELLKKMGGMEGALGWWKACGTIQMYCINK